MLPACLIFRGDLHKKNPIQRISRRTTEAVGSIATVFSMDDLIVTWQHNLDDLKFCKISWSNRSTRVSTLLWTQHETEQIQKMLQCSQAEQHPHVSMTQRLHAWWARDELRCYMDEQITLIQDRYFFWNGRYIILGFSWFQNAAKSVSILLFLDTPSFFGAKFKQGPCCDHK